MIFPEHRAKLRRYALWQKNRDACSDTKKLDVRYFSQLFQQMFQLVVAEQERIAAAQQNVAHGWRLADVFNLIVEARMKIVPARVANQARPRAIPAIRRAPVRYQEQNP